MRKKLIDQRHIAGDCVLKVRSGKGTSRKALAEVMAVSPSTAGLYVDQLLAAGFLLESGLDHGSMGRPKRKLETVPDAGWFAGVEFNAGRAQAVRLDFSGNVVMTTERLLSPEMRMVAVVNEIKQAVVALGERMPGRLLGIGVGAPGVVNRAQGIAGHYAFFKDWHDVPLARRLTDRFDVPVTLENNVRSIALAERWFGGGRDMENYVILGPRTGFGVAIMNGGVMLGGALDAAGEVGNWQWTVADGGQGELHDFLSAPAVWRRLSGVDATAAVPMPLREVLGGFAGVENEATNGVRDDFAKVIGFLHLLLDTEAFFLHGPLCGLGTGFWDGVEARATQLMPRLRGRRPRVICSSLGDDAGALGAASLAMESWLPLLA
jgi:predicted NBD/HSP70 family sugar kinase